nr:hypothetical protein [Tanacetum cinerariifolium]
MLRTYETKEGLPRVTKTGVYSLVVYAPSITRESIQYTVPLLVICMVRHESDIHSLQDQLDDLSLDKGRLCRSRVARNADNKRKWEDNKRGDFGQQQNKRQEVIRAYTTRPNVKNGYGSVFIKSGIRSIRRIEEAQYGALGFLRVGTTIIIFQNISDLAVNMAYVFFWIWRISLQVFMVSWEVQAQIRHIFLMDMTYELSEQQMLDLFV